MTRTKGNIIIEDIRVGDIIYEFSYNVAVKSRVLTEPKLVDGQWSWEAVNVYDDLHKISYMQSSDPAYSFYGLNIYNNEAYMGFKYIGLDFKLNS